jgi:hypothetical protein
MRNNFNTRIASAVATTYYILDSLSETLLATNDSGSNGSIGKPFDIDIALTSLGLQKIKLADES